MTKETLKWKRDFFTIWTGQAISLFTSAILQMAIIFYLTEKTGSAMVLSIASLVGFLPYAVFGPMIGVLVDRYWRKYTHSYFTDRQSRSTKILSNALPRPSMLTAMPESMSGVVNLGLVNCEP